MTNVELMRIHQWKFSAQKRPLLRRSVQGKKHEGKLCLVLVCSVLSFHFYLCVRELDSLAKLSQICEGFFFYIASTRQIQIKLFHKFWMNSTKTTVKAISERQCDTSSVDSSMNRLPARIKRSSFISYAVVLMESAFKLSL